MDVSDQPVYIISKEVQICYPPELGTEKYICTLGDIPMEHTVLLGHDNFEKENGLDTLLLH